MEMDVHGCQEKGSVLFGMSVFAARFVLWLVITVRFATVQMAWVAHVCGGLCGRQLV